jgi:CBS domain-containing protein
LSATDFLHWAERGGPKEKSSNHCLSQPWQMVESEELPETAVRLNMTRDPVTAPANMSVADLARMMLDAHIHRVIVVDKQRRPLGVVSTTDILAAIAYAQKNMPGDQEMAASGSRRL